MSESEENSVLPKRIKKITVVGGHPSRDIKIDDLDIEINIELSVQVDVDEDVDEDSPLAELRAALQNNSDGVWNRDE